jgi:hypothetical protein
MLGTLARTHARTHARTDSLNSLQENCVNVCTPVAGAILAQHELLFRAEDQARGTLWFALSAPALHVENKPPSIFAAHVVIHLPTCAQQLER